MDKTRKQFKSGKSTSDDLTLIQIAAKFSTGEAAREYFENLRWPNGPVCAHCGNCDQTRVYKVTPNPEKKIRAGLYKCAECLQSFTVTVGTVCEDSHIPLNKWLIGFYMMCASKTQVSALQLQRQLEIGSYRSALFMCRRIRFALMGVFPTGNLGGTIEMDETYIVGKKRGMGRSYTGNMAAVVSLVERGADARSCLPRRVYSATLGRLLRDHVSRDACLNTHESPLHKTAGNNFANHDTVNHSLEGCGRYDDDRLVITNTVEGFFGISKCSLDGAHHNVSAKYLSLYLAELDYKHNTRKETDDGHIAMGIPKIVGRRRMLRCPSGNK